MENVGFIRRTLLAIHSTIFDIQDCLWSIEGGDTLSHFEEYVVALEDRRFFAHGGIDYVSILRELKNLLLLKRVHGASTIEMQLYRTLSHRYERQLSRKIIEFIAAKAYQKKFTKIQILRTYLTVAYFGTGLTGSEMASEDVYRRPSNELKHKDALRLAAMLVYPKPKLVNADWKTKVVRRAKYGRFIYWTRPKSLK